MTDERVPVTFEWAHFGKESDDAGYEVLACSDDLVTAERFKAAIIEYWPGSLATDELPQATISWLAPEAGKHYVAMAIHRSGIDGTVLTDYFCLPAGPFSYSEMFNELTRIRLPRPDPTPVKAFLKRTQPEPATARLALKTVELLRTGEPVCVLGADEASLADRLRFIDSVASALPADLRSTVSASTWASSTHREHKLRLFFSSADRGTDDHVVNWAREGVEPPVPAVSSEPVGQVYISYAPEDSDRADRLLLALSAVGIPVWRKSSLLPGEDWRAEIRQAIMRDTLVFIACFSSAGMTAAPRFQNEEIAWALQQFIAYSPDVPWFIPVRFDDCDIPDRDIGGNRTLSSLLPADLFGDQLDDGTARVISAVQRMLSQNG